MDNKIITWQQVYEYNPNSWRRRTKLSNYTFILKKKIMVNQKMLQKNAVKAEKKYQIHRRKVKLKAIIYVRKN